MDVLLKRENIFMKRILPISLFLFSCAIVSLCIAPFSYAAKANLDERIQESADLFGEIMEMPDSAIPEGLLSKSSGVAIFPSVLKGGFIVGARYGKGVILYHNKKTGKWSAPAFFTIKGLSYGLQIGGQAIDLVLVITNERGIRSFLKNHITLGGDLAATAGPVGRDAEASSDLALKSSIFSYSRSKGLFAGVALKGAVIKQEIKSNKDYYGKDVTAEDILFGGKVKPTQSGRYLIKVLNRY